MASTVTRATLIKSILKRLGAWQAGQDLAPEDYETVDEDLDGYLAAMAKADIYVVEDPDAVPLEAYLEVAAYLALEYADDFGVGGEEFQSIGARAGLAEKALRYLRTSKPTYQPAQSTYF